MIINTREQAIREWEEHKEKVRRHMANKNACPVTNFLEWLVGENILNKAQAEAIAEPLSLMIKNYYVRKPSA